MGQGCSSCFSGLMAPERRLEIKDNHEEKGEENGEKQALLQPVQPVQPCHTPEVPAVTQPEETQEQVSAVVVQEPAGAKLAAALRQAEVDANETTSSNQSEAGGAPAINKPAHLTENVSSEECDSVELQTPSGTIATATTAEHIHDGLPSIGSAGHFTGDCKRCCFHPKGRCSNGYECRFCHFDHDKRKRIKKPITPTGPGDMHAMQQNVGPMEMMPQAQAPPACFMPPCIAPPLATVPADLAMDPMQAAQGMRPDEAAAMPWVNDVQMQQMPMPGMAPWQQGPMFPPVAQAPPQFFNPPMWPGPCPGPCPGPGPMMDGPGLVLPRYTSNAGCLLPEAPLGTIPVNSAPVLTMPNQMPPNPMPPNGLLPPGPLLAPPMPQPMPPMPIPEPLPPGAVQAGPMPPMPCPGAPILPVPAAANALNGPPPQTGPAPTPLATNPGPGPAPGPAPGPVPEKPSNPPAQEKGNDSPRSVILKLTGAWNALAAGKGHDLPREPGADFEDMRAMCVPPAR
mmetsp:Transcript_65975/g.134054  ORF Transcript_65975/g.134054 Transcript_65975/m.134054 type:complete len:511 (+) Transcript_65975:80-1612(+)